jgi:two-component sensor histidine kinase
MESAIVSHIDEPTNFPPHSADLAKESDHRIANHLAIISSIIRTETKKFSSESSISPHSVRFSFASISARIDSVARLHRLIRYVEGQATVSVADYLRDVAEATVSSINSNNEISFDATLDHAVNPSAAAAIGLFLCEALTNSMKYAHPTGVMGKIDISAELEDDRFVIAVSDDGVGLPEDFDRAASESAGLVIMKALAAQLGGALTIESPPIGLNVRLALPLTVLADAF